MSDLIKGLASGLAGTALMTLWQELERRARGCERGTLAAEIGATLFGLRPRTDAEIRQYMKYFKWYDAQPAGSVQSSGGH